MNKLKDVALLQKYKLIVDSYISVYNDYHDYLLDYTNPTTRGSKPHIDTLRNLVNDQLSNAEGAIKLILSTFSSGPKSDFMKKHGIQINCDDKKTWFQLSDISVWNNVTYMEILSKLMEEEGIKPCFDLTTVYNFRPKRNNVEHELIEVEILNTPRLLNSIREMLVYLDESNNEKLPSFEYSDNMFDKNSMVMDFDKYTTVLITDPVPDIPQDKRRMVADLPWDFVIDLDGYSSSFGLYSSSSNKEDVNEIYGLGAEIINEKTNWYFCGTYQFPMFYCQGVPPFTIPSKCRFAENKWPSVALGDVIKKIFDAAVNLEDPILVIANTCYSDVMDELIRYIGKNPQISCKIIYIGIPFNIVSNNSRYLSDYTHIYAPICQFFDYIDSIKEQLSRYIKEGATKKYLVPTEKGAAKELSKQLRQDLESCFDILYLDTYGTDTDDNFYLEKNKFYHGGIASWNIISRIDVLCDRTDEEKLINTIKTSLGSLENRKKLFIVQHTPGYGGTTLVRQIAWKLHKKYPVLYVKKFDQSIRDLVMKLYDSADTTPVILVADDTLANFDQLCQLVPLIGRRCCMICSCRIIPNNSSKKIKPDYAFRGLSDEKVRRLREIYMAECRNDGVDELEIKRRDNYFESVKTLSICNPFMIGLNYLYDKYDLETYVKKAFLEKGSPEKKVHDTAVACLALCDIGGAKDVPKRTAVKLFGNDQNVDIDSRYPNLNNLICSIKERNISYLRFQNILLSRKYIELYQKEYGYENRPSEMYLNLSKTLIDTVSSIGSNNDNSLELLISVFIKNKDENNDKISIIIAKLTEEMQTYIMEYLAKVFQSQIDNSTDEELTDASLKKRLVSHAYAHLGRMYSVLDKIKNYFDLSFKYINGQDPNIYHMYADSLFNCLSKEIDADDNYIMDQKDLEERITFIEGQYDQTSELGSPEYGMGGKLKLYSKYLWYTYNHKNITKDNFNYNGLPPFVQTVIEKFMFTLDQLETEYDLNDSTKEIIKINKDKLYSSYLFGEFEKSSGYYHKIMDVYEKGSDGWQRAAFGYISSCIQASKKKAADSGDYYSKMGTEKQEELYKLINSLLSMPDFNAENSVQTYSGYMKSSFLFHHWIRLGKILDTKLSEISPRLEKGWGCLENSTKLSKKSVKPYYYKAVTHLADAMNNNPTSLKTAKESFSEIKNNESNNVFSESSSAMYRKRDILVEGRNNTGRMMDISYCKNEEAILKECIRKKVRPQIVEARFIKDEGNGRAEMEISSPLALAGLQVYIKTGRNAGNDLSNSCQNHIIQLILCICYEEPVALCGKQYVADKTNGEELSIDELFENISMADNSVYEIEKTAATITEPQKPKEPLMKGQKVLFFPNDKYEKNKKILINGKVAGAKARFDLVAEFSRFEDFEEKKKYYNGIDILANSLIREVNEIKCTIVGPNASGYNLSIDESYSSIEEIFSAVKEPKSVPEGKYCPDVPETPRIPNKTQITLTIDKNSNDSIVGTFSFDGKTYRGKVIGIKGKKYKKLMEKNTLDATIVDYSNNIYHLRVK